MPTLLRAHARYERCLIDVAAVMTICVGLSAVPTQAAESLDQALASAYSTNPRIMSERARLRSIDENLARAQSGYRPTIGGEIDYTLRNNETVPSSRDDGTTLAHTYSLTASQPIYSGGQTRYAVSEADANIKAEREVLRDTEQLVLLDAITAYVDVVRDRATLVVQQKNVAVLTQELRQVKARFDVGELTKTDVDQARASLAGAQSSFEGAKANVRASEGRFVLAIGHPPVGLREPAPPLRSIPGNLEEVVANAIADRPSVVQAAFLEKVSQQTIRKLTGQLLPQLSLNAQLSATEDPSPQTEETRTASVTGKVSLPIYEAGEVRAQIRQQKENRQALLENVEQAREQAQSDATSAWAQLQASRAQLLANQTQVDAANTALEGVRAELQVGQRTEIDVLNSQQTLNNAQVTLIATKRDIVVNSYRLLQVMGRLSVDMLSVPVRQYDTTAHYNETNGKWWQITITREPGYAGIDGGLGAVVSDQWHQ